MRNSFPHDINTHLSTSTNQLSRPKKKLKLVVNTKFIIFMKIDK